MSYTVMTRSWALLLICFFAMDPASAARVDVLVVVNDNSIDSPQVGAHYARRRDIDPDNIVHVRVPNQFFISWNEFQSLRDQILRLGICPRIAAAERPAACGDWSLPIYTASNIEALTAATTICYVVLTRGVPTRMRVDGSPLLAPNEPTSVDNYLRFWLARYFERDVNLDFSDRAQALRASSLEDWRRHISLVQPWLDREYVVGRIDGLDLASATALVDRTLQAESDGFFGKLYTHQDQIYPWRHAFGLFDELRPECSDEAVAGFYLLFAQNQIAGRTPVDCRVKMVKSGGTELNENMPGVSAGRQPAVDNAVAYFGHLDGQAAQEGFSTLLNWRKNRTCGSTLCSRAADATACRQASIDPFREIDTRCVGMAPGFMGFNFQSYPVAIFGSWPTGWEPITTSAENDAPRVDTVIGADDAFSVWFDQPDEVAAPLCRSWANGVVNAALSACRARRYLGMRQVLTSTGIEPAVSTRWRVGFSVMGRELAASADVRVTFSVAYQASGSGVCPAGTVWVSASSECVYSGVQTFNVGNSNSWLRYEYTLDTPVVSGSSRVNQVTLQFAGVSAHVGRVGLDAVSVKNAASGQELVRNGSFGGGHLQAAAGDYAANFLSRMGGIAFWGSVGHHQSNGWSFHNNSLRSLTFLLRGLRLGDAVWLGETRNSGVLYGDPVYSPARLRIMPLPDLESRFAGSLRLGAQVMQGQGARAKQVSFSVCRGRDLAEAAGYATVDALRCDADGGWRVLPRADRVVSGSVLLPYDYLPDAASFPEAGDYTLRMQVSAVDPTSASGAPQTFNDYYPITHRYSDAELAIYSIKGRVLSAEGEPLPGVSVTVAGGRADLSDVTDVDGRFAIGLLPDGAYEMTLSYRGCAFSAAGASHVVIAGRDVGQDFRCAASGARITGRVVDASGRPLTAMSVLVSGGSGSSLQQTGTGGYFFSPTLPEGSYTVTASKTGWTFPAMSVVIAGGKSAAVVLSGVLAAGRVAGYVRDLQGNAIAGAQVSGYGAKGLGGFDVVTNRAGFFQHGGLAADTYELAVNAKGFHANDDQHVVVSPGGAPAVITLMPNAERYSISGYVLGSSGIGVGARAVTLTLSNGTTQQTTTSPAGFYRFEDVPAGAHRVRVSGSLPHEEGVEVFNNNVMNADFVVS